MKYTVLILIILIVSGCSKRPKNGDLFSRYFVLPTTDSTTVYYHFVYHNIEEVSGKDSVAYVEKVLNYVENSDGMVKPIDHVSIINDIDGQQATLEDFNYNDASEATIFRVDFNRDSIAVGKYVIEKVFKR